MQDWQSHTQVKTTSTGAGDLVLEATGVSADWQAFTAALDGKEVDVEIEHMTAEFEVEVGRFLYDHSPTPTLLRSLGGTEWSTAGVGVAHSFSVGDKLVSITVNGRTLRELVLFRGSGTTLREDTEFGAGASFPLVITNPLHRSIRITGFGGAALTQAMTVTLPAAADAEWGDEIYVEKIDTSTLTVTVFGFGVAATATHLLLRRGQFIVAKVVGTTTKEWVPQIGAQKSPSAKAQDVIRATDPETQLVTGGAAKIRNATAAQDGLMTTTYAAALDDLAAGLAYEPENY